MNAISRIYYDINLQKAGFETDYVRNGADALHRAVEKPPDLILLDLMLPEVDGTIVCRLLKNDPRTKNIPVVHGNCERRKKKIELRG